MYNTTPKLPSDDQLEQARDVQLSEILNNHWSIVYDDLPILEIPPNYRSSRRTIQNIRHIKETLRDKLGYVAVYAFLNMVGKTVGWLTGPYINVDNILVILYMFVENVLPNSFNKHPSESTIRRNVDLIFKEKHKPSKCKKERIFGREVRNWAEESLKNMFSNPIIRLITAKLGNATKFDFATLFIDGHDNRITYGKKTLYNRKSIKFGKAGIRTQVIIDNQEFGLGVSSSLSCGPNTDSKMWKNMDIHSLVTFGPYDVVFFDSSYLQSMENYIERCAQEGKEFNWNNFRCPIRKGYMEDLDESEQEYNEQFGEFRGMTETFFAHFTSKFKIFGPDSVWKLCEDFESSYNMKFQVCLVLFNIQRFCEKYKIEPETKHTKWMNDNFEFSYINEELNQKDDDVQQKPSENEEESDEPLTSQNIPSKKFKSLIEKIRKGSPLGKRASKRNTYSPEKRIKR